MKDWHVWLLWTVVNVVCGTIIVELIDDYVPHSVLLLVLVACGIYGVSNSVFGLYRGWRQTEKEKQR